MSTVLHRFTCLAQLLGDVREADYRTHDTYVMMPQESRRIFISFLCADNPADAVGMAHSLMQREARAKSDPSLKHKKAGRYGPLDYEMLEVISPRTGSIDFPRGQPNPDLRPQKRAKDQTMDLFA